MEKDHVIIDGMMNFGAEHNIIFIGTHQECIDWLFAKSFDYQILRIEQINKMFKVSSASCRAFLINII